jgi:hypothetical protein
MEDIEKYKEFKKAFWVWFDDILSESERSKFMTYPSDMSELYFYNKIWIRNAHVAQLNRAPPYEGEG